MHFYSVAEARALLPQVIPLLQQIKDAIAELRLMQAAQRMAERGATADGSLVDNPWAEDPDGKDRSEVLTANLHDALAQLSRWGIELKDPEKGLIDFLWQRRGQVVYLCYMLGEPDLAWWHPMETGFAGREPLTAEDG